MDLENSKDFGPHYGIINIHKETICNNNFRTVLWTDGKLQLTVMSIPIGGEIGLEFHDDIDQFIRIESGCATVYMGKSKDSMQRLGTVNEDYALIIPAGTWHNVINTCHRPLKVYSLYAPKKHPFGTVHPTKLDADLAEE